METLVVLALGFGLILAVFRYLASMKAMRTLT